MRITRTTCSLLLLALLATSCGGAAEEDTPAVATESADDGEPDRTDEAPTDEAPTDEPLAAVTVTAVDYAFEGLPQAVAAGTRLELMSGSETELHELIAVRLADDETRGAEQLTVLPEAELEALFAGPPAAVLLAPPGEDGFAVVGDGVLTDPGRYLLLCAIPIGADPQAYLDAPAGEGPPDVAGGPPHFTNGMWAELEVD